MDLTTSSNLLQNHTSYRQDVKPTPSPNRPGYFPLPPYRQSSHPPNIFRLGKRIALPTRVEPKVFFANERTFLSWLNFTVILGALAIGMLNFGDRPAFISSFLFTGVAMATMIYALVTYHWRAKSIRVRGQAGFDDRFGPTLLAIVLLLAVVVNFVLRITYNSREGAQKPSRP